MKISFGDGNCLFRCFALYFFNNQEYYKLIKEFLYAFMLQNYVMCEEIYNNNDFHNSYHCTFEVYLKKYFTNFWGGDFACLMTSNIMQVNINIWIIDRNELLRLLINDSNFNENNIHLSFKVCQSYKNPHSSKTINLLYCNVLELQAISSKYLCELTNNHFNLLFISNLQFYEEKNVSHNSPFLFYENLYSVGLTETLLADIESFKSFLKEFLKIDNNQPNFNSKKKQTKEKKRNRS